MRRKKSENRHMAALLKTMWNEDSPLSIHTIRAPSPAPQKEPKQLEFTGVFRGHELTRKDRRLSSGLAPLDVLIGGGIPRGRISEITGRAGSGKTSIAASFASFATRRGEVAAWLDASGSFDPESMREAGVELRRMLWASIPDAGAVGQSYGRFARPIARRQSAIVKAAELVLEAGGFGLVVVDFGETPRALTHSSALRIARAAQRCGRDCNRTVADVRDVLGAQPLDESRGGVVQPTGTGLARHLRRNRGGYDGGAQQDGRHRA
jgi:hypothetical protein